MSTAGGTSLSGDISARRLARSKERAETKSVSSKDGGCSSSGKQTTPGGLLPIGESEALQMSSVPPMPPPLPPAPTGETPAGRRKGSGATPQQSDRSSSSRGGRGSDPQQSDRSGRDKSKRRAPSPEKQASTVRRKTADTPTPRTAAAELPQYSSSSLAANAGGGVSESELAESKGKAKRSARFAANEAGAERERLGEQPPPSYSEYEGSTNEEGLAEGHGFGRYANGDEYLGDWRGDKREGQGSCTFATGEFYDGDWKGDRREGFGSTRYASGDKYEGEWRAGLREGRGRAMYANRDRYEGQWLSDKKQGFGTFWAASGEVYEGQWLVGTYDGRGTYLYASGDVYEGEYKQGRREGRGVYMYAAGDVYEGEYKQGRMEGRGTYRLADGSAEVGRYKAGTDVGEGARWTPDRCHAWRLRNGKVVEEISLEEAARVASSLGLSVPAPVLDAEADVDDEAAGEPMSHVAEQMSSMSLSTTAPQLPVAVG